MPNKNQKEESKEAPQKRTSNMDALKQQILLRKQSMNPGLAGKGADEPKKNSNLAALSMKMSKFGHDDDDDVEESENESESDQD